MSYVRRTDRSEVLLLPEAIDDYITQDNPVRFIDAFLTTLDLLQLGFTHASPASTGRPAYDPADLLRLYVYGYLNRLRSSPMLEGETTRNVELMWLLGKITPDFKTIADFRKQNLAAIKAVCREFTLLCKRLDLFAGELIAIDGSKFRAVNSRKRNFTALKLARLIDNIDKKIADYLAEMDLKDSAQPAVANPSAKELATKIEQLKQSKQHFQDLAAESRNSDVQELSLTDPDSRLMSVGQGLAVCYNVETAVDSKHKLIVYHEVTNATTDQQQLAPIATAAKEMLGVDSLEVVADKGYYSGEQVSKCESEGILTYIPKPHVSPKPKKNLFTKEDFIYDSETDSYRCREGKQLTYRYTTPERKGQKQRYYKTAACKSCAVGSVCTDNKRERVIKRLIDEAVMQRMAERLRGSPEKMKLRGRIVEHPYGRMKRGMNQGYFLMRGIKKVAAEMSLTVLCYNLKRVLNILGVEEMIRAVA